MIRRFEKKIAHFEKKDRFFLTIFPSECLHSNSSTTYTGQTQSQAQLHTTKNTDCTTLEKIMVLRKMYFSQNEKFDC